MTNAPMTWHNTLYNRSKAWDNVDNFAPIAKQLGYPYFCWNGRIYATEKYDPEAPMSHACVGRIVNYDTEPPTLEKNT